MQKQLSTDIISGKGLSQPHPIRSLEDKLCPEGCPSWIFWKRDKLLYSCFNQSMGTCLFPKRSCESFRKRASVGQGHGLEKNASVVLQHQHPEQLVEPNQHLLQRVTLSGRSDSWQKLQNAIMKLGSEWEGSGKPDGSHHKPQKSVDTRVWGVGRQE